MTFAKIIGFCIALLGSSAAFAGPIKLEPANPQPSGLKSGLSVKYALPERQIKTLAQADDMLKSAKPGTPLTGLDYWDTEEGEETLTSGKAWWVAAEIGGISVLMRPASIPLIFWSMMGCECSLVGKRSSYGTKEQRVKPSRRLRSKCPQQAGTHCARSISKIRAQPVFTCARA